MKYCVTRRDVNGRSDFLLKCQWVCAGTIVCKLDETGNQNSNIKADLKKNIILRRGLDLPTSC